MGTYNQYCATARTLDLIGERWTVLIIRELLTGPRRFGDFQQSLRGLGTGLLAARLKHLEQEGLVHKVTLPPPARTPAYALTQAGQELGPAVMELAKWGLKWALGDRREGEQFHPGWAVLSLRACFDAEAAAGVRALYEFRIDDEVFHARIDDGRIEAVHGPAQYPDVVIATGAETFLEVCAGRIRLAEAVECGAATATGDLKALELLPGLIRIPAQQARIPAPVSEA